MTKLKVLEIINGLGLGGANRTLQSTCRYLNKNQFDLKVVAVFEGGKRADELTAEGFPVRIFNGDIVSLLKYLRDESFDIIHLHRRGAYEYHWYELLKDKPAKLVVETNIFAEYDSQTYPLVDAHLFKSMMMLNERYLPNLSPSEQSNFWPKHRVLYNPVDIKYFGDFKLTPDQILEKRQSLGISDQELVIGKVGARATLEKWSDLVADMFPILLKDIPNVKMIIQSAPQLIVGRLKKTPWSKQFIFLPETADEALQAQYYQMLDVFVHTSKIGEAFGNTINEAMVWRRPIVLSSTPWVDNGQLEQVEHGINGYFANTPKSFAAAVSTLLKDKELAVKFGQAGYNKVSTEYQPEKIIGDLEAIFLGNEEHLFHPSKEGIITYRQEYRRRLQQDFLRSTSKEWLKYIAYPSIYTQLKMIKKGSRY